MTTQQQTERDEREMLARWLTDTLEYVQNPENVANRDRLLALLRGDEPAKLDRYVVAFKDAKDAYIGPNRTEHESDQAAAAVLRRHFPSVEVPREIAQALGWLREVGRFGQPFSITPQIYKAFFMPAIEALTQAAGE